MTRRELRQQMREQKKQMRARMAELRKQARAQTDQLPAVKKAKARKRIRRTLTVVALLLLALLVRCDCAEPPELPPVVPPKLTEAPAPKAPVVVPAKAKVKPLVGRVESQSRGKYANQAKSTPSWLQEFYLQVSARSPRLSECFTGTERPGALRWAAALNAKSGAVSDHEIEPLGAGADLDQKQRECVIATLSKPTYRLKVPEGEALPSRVGLVIEF